MRAEAALWYDNNSNTYVSVCTDPVVLSASSSAASGASYVGCTGSGQNFAMLAVFKVGDTTLPAGLQGAYCVDSNGYAGGSASTTVVAGAPCK